MVNIVQEEIIEVKTQNEEMARLINELMGRLEAHGEEPNLPDELKSPKITRLNPEPAPMPDYIQQRLPKIDMERIRKR